MEAEPVWDITKNKDQLSQLINWYSYYKDYSDAQRYILDYYSGNKELEDLYKTLPLEKIKKGVGWVARIISREPESKKDLLKYLEEDIARCKNILVEKNKEETVSIKKEPVKINIQDRINFQILEIKAEIEGKLDEYITSKQSKTFSIKEILERFRANHVHVSRIKDYYQDNLLKELKEAYSNKDPQLTEAYSFLKRKDLKAYIDFLGKLLEELNSFGELSKEISKSNRRPRRKKNKSPVDQVSKLLYLKEWESYKSVYPTDIIGSSQLWVYNVKTKVLGFYRCDNPHGFFVKGSSLKNFEDDSVGKSLRKPLDILPKVLSEGKLALRKIFSSLSTKEKKLNGRFNKDTLILKVTK